MSRRHKSTVSDADHRVGEDNLDSPPISINHHKQDMTSTKGHTDFKKKPLSEAKVQTSLKQEILQLEKRLQDQLTMRSSLENALGSGTSSIDSSAESLMPKPTKELIREIAVLELEVTHLEQYLLSLYRKAFDQQISTVSPASEDKPKQPLNSQARLFQEAAKLDVSSKRGNLAVHSDRIQLPKKWAADLMSEAQAGPGVYRSHSSLSQRAVCSARIAPSEGSLARALHSFHSQPLSFQEEGENDTLGVISLAEYVGTSIADHIPETPNKLSEDMVRCMGAIYCKLAEPPLVYRGLPSPASSLSSTSALSPQYLGDMWSPGYKKESTLDSRLINPFHVEGLKEFSGPYNTMVEVPLICRDRRRLRDVKAMLQNYKSIIHQLETVDPRKMKNAEKLAFWINIHNALMMQAYLEYGIPRDNMKKTSLLVKGSCIIGGRPVNAAIIQGFILRCRTQCSSQWFRTLLHQRMKYKAGEWLAFGVEQPEPLLRFALCSGSHSDPAVRIYTSKKLFLQLESAKEEFIRATVGIWKEQKILVPKIIESYAKDKKLSSGGLVDMIQHCLPDTLRVAMQKCQQRRSHKIIQWVPHDFAFRYLLPRELAFPHMN